MGTILSIWTVLVLVIFLAIVIWAWSSSNKSAFDAAARIPFEDDEQMLREETDNG